MPMACSVCKHPARELIDRALVERSSSIRHLAAIHKLTHSALSRHKQSHLVDSLCEAHQQREDSHGSFMLQRLEAIFHETARIFQENALGDHAVALRAAQRLEHQLELIVKYLPTSDLSETLLKSERRLLRTAIDEALAPWPEARQALADKLRTVTLDAA